MYQHSFQSRTQHVINHSLTAPYFFAFIGSFRPFERRLAERNSVGIKLVWLSADSFTMGSPLDEQGRDANKRQVELKLTEGFWLGQTGITQSQWTQLMGTSPWRGNSNMREGKNFAASFISWEDASSFVERLNSKERGSSMALVHRRTTGLTHCQRNRNGSTRAVEERSRPSVLVIIQVNLISTVGSLRMPFR